MKTFTKIEDVTEEGHYWYCPQFLIEDNQERLPNAWQVIYIVPGHVNRVGVFKGPLTPPESAE